MSRAASLSLFARAKGRGVTDLFMNHSRFIDLLCGKWLSSPAHNRTLPKETMAHSSPPDTTRLLLAWRAGDQQALAQLTALVHDELRRLAARYMRRERADHTLQATALVNEVYLQLIDQHQVDWQNRAHFIGVAARLMRQILVDHARAHAAAKRGQGAAAVPLDDAIEVPGQTGPDVLALDDALHALAEVDPRKERVIELRFFGGLSVEETAEVLQVSPDTVMRDWRLARVWLLRELSRGTQ